MQPRISLDGEWPTLPQWASDRGWPEVVPVAVTYDLRQKGSEKQLK